MALHDLTPQLRTRLSRMERGVGWFVLLAAALLAFGFGYYVYHTAERKGWFKIKASYFTLVDRATGLKVGDPVKLMGFDVGEITRIEAQPPNERYNVFVEFEIQNPYYDYLWTVGSRARVTTADLLGKRVIEVTKGSDGYPIYLFNPFKEIQLVEAKSLPEWEKWDSAEAIYDGSGTNLLVRALVPLPQALDLARTTGLRRLRVRDRRAEGKAITAAWNDREGRYEAFTRTSKPYWLVAEESPAVTERLEQLVGEVEKALPGILALTNQVSTVLSNSAILTSNLNAVAVDARPVVSNMVAATAHLDQPGALGEWLLPTNIHRQLETVLGSAETTLTGAGTNLTLLAENLSRSLDNLANVTSNLNHQVASNTNILSEISGAVVHADELVQGLKRHWLLRSAFKKPKTNAPPGEIKQLRAPKYER